jgi:hypothetical protein
MLRDSFVSIPIVGMIIAAIVIVLIALSIPSRMQIEADRYEEERRQKWIRGNLSVICLDGFEYYYYQSSGGSTNLIMVPRFDSFTDKPKHCLLPPIEDEEEEGGE